MEQRNLLLAIALSIGILWSWTALFPAPEELEPTAQQVTSGNLRENTPLADPQLRPNHEDSIASVASNREPTANPQGINTTASLAGIGHSGIQTDGESRSALFNVSSDLLRVSMDEKGWLTDAALLDYTESLESNSDNVHVLSHQLIENSIEFRSTYINFGVLGTRNSSPFVAIEGEADQPGVSRFRTTLDNGLVWERSLSIEPGTYLLHVEDRIINGIGMKMFRQIVQRNPDESLKTFYEHVGPVGFLNGELQKVNYEDLAENKPVRMAALGGWTAMMDRYFIIAMLGNEEQSYRYFYKGESRSYQSGLLDDGTVDNSDAVFTTTFYIGPKSIPLMRTIEVELERSVDFGWFAFIAKPMHDFILWIYDYVHNFGWAIIILVILIKIIFFYPTQKAYQSMAGMRKLQPEQERLKELHGDDRQKLGQEMMALYKKNKVNPMGGCLPILIQIPVFFSLYKVLLMSIEMRQSPFIFWLDDLSVQDPFYVLPVVMGISMYIQQKLNPQPTDPIQAKVMQFLPPMFTVMFLFFPSGLVLYWVVNNILSIIQQRYVLKVNNAL